MFKKISTLSFNLAVQTVEYRDYFMFFVIYQETITVLYTILMPILQIITVTSKKKNVEW